MLMGKDEIFNSMAGGLSILGMYMKAAVDKYGIDKALELYGEVGKGFGDTSAWRQRFGDRTPTAEELREVLLSSYGGMGFDVDITAGKGTVTNKLYRCPFYTGFSIAGMSHDVISKFCKAAFTAKMRVIEKDYPQITMNEEPRKTPDGFCVETYKIKAA